MHVVSIAGGRPSLVFDAGVSQHFHCSLIEDVSSRGVCCAVVARDEDRLDALFAQVEGECCSGRAGADDEDGDVFRHGRLAVLVDIDLWMDSSMIWCLLIVPLIPGSCRVYGVARRVEGRNNVCQLVTGSVERIRNDVRTLPSLIDPHISFCMPEHVRPQSRSHGSTEG